MTKQLEVFRDGLLDFAVARQRTPVGHAESFGRLGFRQSIILNTLLHDDSRGFLCDHAACPRIAVCCLFAHSAFAGQFAVTVRSCSKQGFFFGFARVFREIHILVVVHIEYVR